jgi:hypothetical protein
VETICLKCLAEEPGRRYGSAEALAEDLERWLRGEPVTARPVTRLERAWLWRKRNPAVAGLVTAFVAALLAGTAFSTYFAINADNNYQAARRFARESEANYQDARRREREAGDALARATEREQQLEAALAGSLLRPLGDASWVTESELDALWELAASSERVRVLFVKQALQRPPVTRRLRARADMAIHAAVGLDPARRRQVEEMLLARLGDPQSDFGVRADCVAT